MRVTQKHNEECKRLLRLMGVPVVEAPCEAEAQCSALCKEGVVRIFFFQLKKKRSLQQERRIWMH